MLQIPTWSKIVTGLILVLGILIALPNALPGSIVSRIPAFLPKGAVALGLDLQGGAQLLLEVDFDQIQKDKIESLTGDIRVALRKAHFLFKFLPSTPDSVSVQILEPNRYAEAKTLLSDLKHHPERLVPEAAHRVDGGLVIAHGLIVTGAEAQ